MISFSMVTRSNVKTIIEHFICIVLEGRISGRGENIGPFWNSDITIA